MLRLALSRPRAAFVRVFTVANLMLTVAYIAAAFWVNPTMAPSLWITEFPNLAKTMPERLAMTVWWGFMGVHLAVALSSVLVLVGLAKGIGAVGRRRILLAYLGVVAVFLLIKAVGLAGVQLQGLVDIHYMTTTGEIIRANGWVEVGKWFAASLVFCLPAFALVLAIVTTPANAAPDPSIASGPASPDTAT